MLTHTRVKNWRAKKGCLLCFNMGAASKAYAYVEIHYFRHLNRKMAEDEGPVQSPEFIMTHEKQSLPVVKEIGLCYRHVIQVCDKERGEWKRSPYGFIPCRDNLYFLIGDDVTLVTGPSGKVPKWW